MKILTPQELQGLPRAESMAFPDRPQTAREWGRFAHILLRTLITKDPPVYEWEIDVSAAVERFKIKQLVTVERVGWLRQEGRCGTCISSSYSHSIILSDGMSPEEASSTIWHELKHAQQVERLGIDTYSLMYAISTNKSSWFAYSQSPFEREAYLAMNNHFTHPLAHAIS